MKSRDRESWPLSAERFEPARTYPFGTSAKGGAPTASGTKPLQTAEALYRTRTDDPFLTMEVLYQLSYPGEMAC